MPNSKSRSHKNGSLKFSRLGLKTSVNKNRSKGETISKYFTSNNTQPAELHNKNNETVDDCGEGCSKSVDVDSPYKSSLTEIENLFAVNCSSNDENDFKSPNGKINLCNQKFQTDSKRKPKDLKKSKQGLFAKSKQNKKDVNPEHLELAIALSKSISDCGDVTNDLDNSYPSTQQKIATVKQTLEQFGFKSGAGKLPVGNRRSQFTKKKRSRFRYITPTLFLRTQEDREKITAEKVATILSTLEDEPNSISQNHTTLPPVSKELKQIWDEESTIFQKSGEHFVSYDFYYVTSLDVPQGGIKCGTLLKNWSQIPGRTSPIQVIASQGDNVKNKTENVSKASDENSSCMSPELFSSDDDEKQNSNFLKNIQENLEKDSLDFEDVDKNCSESLLTPRKKFKHMDSLSKQNEATEILGTADNLMNKTVQSDTEDVIKDNQCASNISPKNPNGILVFESFQEDNTKIECFDLTQSSDDEIDNQIQSTVNDFDYPKEFSDLKRPSNSINLLRSPAESSLSLNSAHEDSDIIHNKSLNITKYIQNMLENKLESTTDQTSSKIDLTCSSSSLNKSDTALSRLSDSKVRMEEKQSFNSTTSNDINLSQISLSDEELNYSSAFSTLHKPQCETRKSYLHELIDENFELHDHFSSGETEELMFSTPKTLRNLSDVTKSLIDDSKTQARCKSFTSSPQDVRYECATTRKSPRKSLFDSDNVFSKISQPLASTSADETILQNNVDIPKAQNLDHTEPISTPKGKILIKTVDVTPMSNYSEMNSPQVIKELEKFGLKPLKRKRGVQFLKHIYESTHPVVPQQEKSVNGSLKRRKTDSELTPKAQRVSTKFKSFNKRRSFEQSAEDEFDCNVSTASQSFSSEVGFSRTSSQIEVVGDLMTSKETLDDLIFERKQPSKIHSCRIPLHIVWHNLVSSEPNIRRNILQYEPLQVEVLHQNIKDQGFKFHIQDLLTFLDRKCITIRTNQNQTNRKKTQKKSKKKL